MEQVIYGLSAFICVYIIISLWVIIRFAQKIERLEAEVEKWRHEHET